MPPKSTRVRKTPNREPVSAIATRTAPIVPVPALSSDQLATQLIDPQLPLCDTIITGASGLNDNSQDDENYHFVYPRNASILLGHMLIVHSKARYKAMNSNPLSESPFLTIYNNQYE
jgi:hypothetical protein